MRSPNRARSFGQFRRTQHIQFMSIDELNGRALDAQVAQRVFGLQIEPRVNARIGETDYVHPLRPGASPNEWVRIPFYSVSLAAALNLEVALQHRGWRRADSNLKDRRRARDPAAHQRATGRGVRPGARGPMSSGAEGVLALRRGRRIAPDRRGKTRRPEVPITSGRRVLSGGLRLSDPRPPPSPPSDRPSAATALGWQRKCKLGARSVGLHGSERVRECTRRRRFLWPRPSECSVFCSHDSVRCPPQQLEAAVASGP